MDYFEYEYDVTIEMEERKSDDACYIGDWSWYVALGALIDSIWEDDGNSITSSHLDASTPRNTRKTAPSNEMKRAYDEMVKAQKNIKNEHA